MAATFIVDTQGKDWTTDQHAYGLGVAGVLDALLRRVPPGPDRWVTIEGIVSRLLTGLLTRAWSIRRRSKRKSGTPRHERPHSPARPGAWELKYDIGRDPKTGRRITKYKTVRGAKREAQRELGDLLGTVDRGQTSIPAS